MDVMLRGVGGGGSGDNVQLTLCVEKSICESSLSQVPVIKLNRHLERINMYIKAFHFHRQDSSYIVGEITVHV